MSGAWHILLVEDNPDHAELVRRSLESFPLARLIHLEDGEAALDYLLGQGDYADRTRFPWPDLVLLDLRLPRVDGLEVLRRVQQHATLSATPMVVLTTSDAERDVATAFEYHASHFLTKPVNVQRLGQLLTNLGFWKGADPTSPPPNSQP